MNGIMDGIQTTKTVDMLTRNSVSILTQNFIYINGVKTQVGKTHRCAYANSEQDRQELIQNQPEDVVNSVLAIWGDEPTIIESNPEEPAETENGGDEPAE